MENKESKPTSSKSRRMAEQKTSHSEDRQGGSKKEQTMQSSMSRQNKPGNEGKSPYNQSQNVRASISKEVSTTPQHTVQPRQTNKKFDNCVTKFAFATKTGFSPKNPNKIN